MKYFELSEFDSPDFPGSGKNMDAKFLEKIEMARDIANIPFRINSGYRTKEHNAYIGGSKYSSHCYGYAVDIHCTDSRSRAIIIDSLQKAGFNRFGIAKTFIHVDNDPEKDANVIWLY
jgi:zinc D-Ala-D-Ala carboxypeptidase